MKKFIAFPFLFLFFALSAAATTPVSQVIPLDQMKLGKKTSGLNKTFTFDLGLGSSNPQIRANASSQKLEYAHDGATFNQFGSDISLGPVTKTANATLTSADRIVKADATSGSITLILPAASTVTGKPFYIVKIDSSGNAVVIDGNASELINGELTQSLFSQYGAVILISDGSNWYVF